MASSPSPGGAVTIGATAGSTLTLDGGAGTDFDLSAANQNLTVNAAVALGNAAHIWDVAVDRTLTLASVSGSSVSTVVAKQGAGTATVQSATMTLQGIRVGVSGANGG